MEALYEQYKNTPYENVEERASLRQRLIALREENIRKTIEKEELNDKMTQDLIHDCYVLGNLLDHMSKTRK